MIKKILVPLDGSANAQRVLGWTSGIARALKAEIELFAAVDPSKIALPDATALPEHPLPGHAHQDKPVYEARDVTIGYGDTLGLGAVDVGTHPGREEMYPPAFGTQLIDRAVEFNRRFLLREAGQLEKQGLNVSVATAVGKPPEEIVKHAAEGQIDMIAMVTHRGSTVARGVLGSVTDRVLHTSSVPVLTAHPRHDGALAGAEVVPQTVVVPLDGSDLSALAVAPAIEIARATRASIRFIRVIESTYYPLVEFGAAYDSGFRGTAAREEESYDYLERYVKQAENRGVGATAHVRVDNAADAIISEAERSPVAMIVMGTRGRSGVTRWALGSVSDKVVRGSGLPVLVVPPQASSEAGQGDTE